MTVTALADALHDALAVARGHITDPQAAEQLLAGAEATLDAVGGES